MTICFQNINHKKIKLPLLIDEIINRNILENSSLLDNLIFLNNIQTKNIVCAYNSSLELYRCNNILEEKYDSHDNLIYIKTKEKEYYYNYLYNQDNLVKEMSFENNILNFEYDEINRLKNIYYLHDGILDTIKYSYINMETDPYFENSFNVPKEIKVFTPNNTNLKYYYIYNRNINTNEIEEIKYNSAHEIIEKKNFNVFSKPYHNIFKLINYIPEPYYENNFFETTQYKYQNHNNTLDNFAYYQTKYTNINGNKVNSINDKIYNDTKDYIIKYNGNDIEYTAFKNKNIYLKYKFIKKTYHNKNYIEIEKKEINETEYNKLFL